eukprot:COSAG02_NODE_25056_length_670_cov_0.712785_1_plen_183_part_01
MFHQSTLASRIRTKTCIATNWAGIVTFVLPVQPNTLSGSTTAERWVGAAPRYPWQFGGRIDAELTSGNIVAPLAWGFDWWGTRCGVAPGEAPVEEDVSAPPALPRVVGIRLGRDLVGIRHATTPLTIVATRCLVLLRRHRTAVARFYVGFARPWAVVRHVVIRGTVPPSTNHVRPSGRTVSTR